MSASLQDGPITNSEVGTIICALRLWQEQNGPGEYCGEHFGGNENPLLDKQVDELCERLNFGRTVLIDLPPKFGQDDARSLLDWVNEQSPDSDSEEKVACQRAFMETVVAITADSSPCNNHADGIGERTCRDCGRQVRDDDLSFIS